MQLVEPTVEPSVVQQFATCNTQKAVCKFVALNSQQNRTNPKLLSVASEHTNENRASSSSTEHVTRRVSWFDLTKKGTPSSLTNSKLRHPGSGVFPGHIITAGRCEIVTCSGMRRLSVNIGTI